MKILAASLIKEHSQLTNVTFLEKVTLVSFPRHTLDLPLSYRQRLLQKHKANSEHAA